MRNIFIFIIALTLFTSCSLEQKNQEEISGDDIINTNRKALGVLAQAYSSLPVGGEPFTLLTEDLQPTYLINNKPDYKLTYGWNDEQIKIVTGQLWKSYYESLVHINSILNTEQYINNKNEEWNYIKGNALCLKAYIYFDLLQLYSERYNPSALGIITKDNITLENNKRLTQEETITIIKTLLDQGIDLMKKYNKQYNYFITSPAAINIKAQIYLYTKEYSKAEQTARELISLFPTLPNTEKDYTEIWNISLSETTTATYWIYNNLSNPNRYLYVEKDKGDYLFINHNNIFEKDDIRYNISQYMYKMRSLEGGISSPTVLRPYLGKYKTQHTDHSEKNIVLSRNTETYFILIESLLEQGKLNEATDYLNQFFTSVNNTSVADGLSQSILKSIVQKEKQKEFVGEKINYFDLKRWNLPIKRYFPDSNKVLLTIQNNDFRWTWPIPDSELRYNNNAIQNEGWPTFVNK